MAECKIQQVHKKSSEVKTGPLDLVQKAARKKTKTYFAVLERASKNGLARLELYEDEKNASTLQPLITLVCHDVVKVESVSHKNNDNALLVSTKNQHYTFLTQSSVVRHDWVKKLQSTLLAGTQDTCCVPRVNNTHTPCDEILPQKFEFIVKIADDTQDKLHTKGNVRLTLEKGSITVTTLLGKMIAQWPIKHIRRFGRADTAGIFFLEAGRKSTVGEGMFNFITEQAENIMVAIEKIKSVTERMDRPGLSHIQPGDFGTQPLPTVQPEPQHGDAHIYEDFYIPAAHNINQVPVQEKVPLEIHLPTKPIDVPHHNETGIKNVVQEPTYDDPVIIKDAWKSNGFDDSDTYSSLEFPARDSSKKEEDHYWKGDTSLNTEEAIYAVVDHSRKKKNNPE